MELNKIEWNGMGWDGKWTRRWEDNNMKVEDKSIHTDKENEKSPWGNRRMKMT